MLRIRELARVTPDSTPASIATRSITSRRPRVVVDFDKADTDKDGSLTFEEIEVYSRTTGR